MVPAWNVVARFLVLWLIATLVSTLAAKLAEERCLSRTDALTGLPNARAFHEATDAEIARMGRTGSMLTAAYVDVDDFKSINDTHGHAGGDDVLALVGQVMASALRRTDVVARFGGDEFAVLLPDTDLEDALGRLRKLHAGLLVATAAYLPAVRFSVGAVAFIGPPHSADHLLSLADRAMYHVKRQGKNPIWGEPADASPRIEHHTAGRRIAVAHGSPVADGSIR